MGPTLRSPVFSFSDMRTALFSLFAFLCVGSLFAEPPVEAMDDSSRLYGTWQGFRSREGLLLGRADVRYTFSREGWTIEDDEGTHLQAWFRLQGDTLYLGPAGTPTEEDERLAILIPFVEEDVFEIPNPSMPQGISLCFQRDSKGRLPSARSLVGRYQLTFQRIGSEKVHTSPFEVVLKGDGRYELQQEPPLGVGYAKGRYEVEGATLTLLPDTPQAGFWERPSFFLFQSTLYYDGADTMEVKLLPLPPAEAESL